MPLDGAVVIPYNADKRRKDTIFSQSHPEHPFDTSQLNFDQFLNDQSVPAPLKDAARLLTQRGYALTSLIKIADFGRLDNDEYAAEMLKRYQKLLEWLALMQRFEIFNLELKAFIAKAHEEVHGEIDEINAIIDKLLKEKNPKQDLIDELRINRNAYRDYLNMIHDSEEARREASRQAAANNYNTQSLQSLQSIWQRTRNIVTQASNIAQTWRQTFSAGVAGLSSFIQGIRIPSIAGLFGDNNNPPPP